MLRVVDDGVFSLLQSGNHTRENFEEEEMEENDVYRVNEVILGRKVNVVGEERRALLFIVL